MADIILQQGENTPSTVRTRLADMQDDAETHAITRPVVLGAIVNGVFVQLPVDDLVTNALMVISEVHREVHEGETFQASRKSPDGSPVADNATLTILLRTGAKTLHLTWSSEGGADAEIEFLEGTVVSNAGTALVFENMNRTLSGIVFPTTVITYDPTITNAGNLLHNRFLPGGTGGNSAGGQDRQDTEWILKATTAYLLRLTNRGGNAQPLSLGVQGYEE